MKLNSTNGRTPFFEQTIVNLIHIGKVVEGLPVGIFVVDADLVIEDRVEADVLETGRLLHLRADPGDSCPAG